MANLIHLLAPIFFMFTFTTPTLSSNNVLYSSQILNRGKSLTYKDYALTLQHDCNLVLSGPNHAILWQTSTSQPLIIGLSCYLKLNSNGMLVLFTVIHPHPIPPYPFPPVPHVQWSSGVKSEEGEYALVLGYDGSLKIYGTRIWSSRNKVKESYQYLEPSKGSKIPVTDSTLWSGDIAPIGTVIVKDNYELELGMTCNLTLTDTKSGHVLWHTNTYDITRSCFVNLDRDGELKVKYLGGATLWSNNASSYWGQEVLVIRPDGILTVYGPVLWSLKKSSGGEANIAMVTA